jgi:hypothetical protein
LCAGAPRPTKIPTKPTAQVHGFIQTRDIDRGGYPPFSLLSNVFENSVYKEMAICQLFKMNRFIHICIKLEVGVQFCHQNTVHPKKPFTGKNVLKKNLLKNF